jgi:hypothetical protein
MNGHINSQKVKMIFLDTKEETIFKSVAYAKRITGIVEYQIKQSMNPLNKKRFTYQNRLITFRIVK